MSNISKIYAGDNIYIEELDDESIRIHAEQMIGQASEELQPYMAIVDYVEDDGNINYEYLKMINNVIRVNGEYFELDDYIKKISNSDMIYDIYISVEMNDFDTETRRFSYDFSFQMVGRSDTGYYAPEGANYFHIYRIIRHGNFLETLRIAPIFLDVVICNYGFVGYEDYKLTHVRNNYGADTYDNVYTLPIYSKSEGFLTIRTPFTNSTTTDYQAVLCYYGADSMTRVNFDYFEN